MTETNQAASAAAGAMTPLDLAKEIRPLLTRAELLYSRRSEESQLSRAQLSIMMTLDALGPCRITNWRRRAIRMPRLNAVHHLEDAGMVERVRDTGPPRRPRRLTKGPVGLRRSPPSATSRWPPCSRRSRNSSGAALVPVLKRILETYGEDRAATAE